eukprot:167285-Pyramimonas_sp.AAC.1
MDRDKVLQLAAAHEVQSRRPLGIVEEQRRRQREGERAVLLLQCPWRRWASAAPGGLKICRAACPDALPERDSAGCEETPMSP